jgi:predicted transcriptional regulator
MGKAKADALKVIESLPDDCTWEDIKYRVYVHDAIEQGLADVEAGRVVSADEAKRRIAEWLASPGPTQP